MDRSTLVSFDIELGNQVVAALDRFGLKPNVALWAVLASKKLDQKSLFKADGDVLAALRHEQVGFHNLPPILVYRMTDKFIVSLRHTFAGTQSVHGMRLGSQSFGGRYLEEGYVYRIV
jgi:hypothetical protein